MKYSELNEKKAHGSADFPIEFYRVDQGNGQYVMPAHWHTEAEIIRIVEGRFSLTLNKRHYLMTTGDIAFVNPGTVHHGEPENCRYECAVFKLDMLLQSGNAVNRYLNPLLSRKMAVTEFFAHDSAPSIAVGVDRLFSLLRTPSEHEELAVYAALYGLFFTFYDCHAVVECYYGKAQERQMEQLTTLLTWIEDHYTERISLTELARAAGMNEKYLCRFFRGYTACTPVEYINRLRVEKAAYDIRFRHLSVTEAAYANGFNDSAYFSKLFLRINGMSPSQYAKTASK